MFAPYGRGFRAGRAEPRTQRPGGTRGIKMIIEPSCPYPGLRFISYTLWWSGYLDGRMKSLSQPIKRMA